MKYSIMFIVSMMFTTAVMGQVPVWKFTDLQKFQQSKDSVLVINFWATWCKPCVHELPHFDVALQEFKGKPVKFLLVSLDFKRELETKLVPFVKAKNIQVPVVLLDEPDYNSWIDKVDSSWSGAIPGTLFIDQNGKRKFMEKELELEELISAIQNTLEEKAR